jgi:hypothetical protein
MEEIFGVAKKITFGHGLVEALINQILVSCSHRKRKDITKCFAITILKKVLLKKRINAKKRSWILMELYTLNDIRML